MVWPSYWSEKREPNGCCHHMRDDASLLLESLTLSIAFFYFYFLLFHSPASASVSVTLFLALYSLYCTSMSDLV